MGSESYSDMDYKLRHSPPTGEDLDVFIDCHVKYMSALIGNWLKGVDYLLMDCSAETRKEVIATIALRIKQRVMDRVNFP